MHPIQHKDPTHGSLWPVRIPLALPVLLALSAGWLVACAKKVSPGAVEQANSVTSAAPSPGRASDAPRAQSRASKSAADTGNAAVLGPCTPTSCNYENQACCESEPDRTERACVPKSAMPDPRGGSQRCYPMREQDWMGIECLSSAQCPTGLRCCNAGFEPGITVCAAECQDREACVPDGSATCHPGSHCKPTPDTRSGGSCVVASPGVECGQRRCSGNAPACRYNRKTGRSKCLALNSDGSWPDDPAWPPSDDLLLLECASPKDCPGERCCIGGPLAMSLCTGSCTTGIDVCDTVEDCPAFVGPPVGCESDPEGPAFLKYCRYRSHTPGGLPP